MMSLSVWILVLLTGPITARVQQPFYTTQTACQAHETGGWKCVEFLSRQPGAVGRLP